MIGKRKIDYNELGAKSNIVGRVQFWVVFQSGMQLYLLVAQKREVVGYDYYAHRVRNFCKYISYG